MNFDNYERVYEYYDGAAKKKAIRIAEDIYMVKYPVKSEQANELQDTYSNSSFSEYVSCHIINELNMPGVTAQETILGESNNHIAVACKDFTTPYIKLVKFSMLQNADFTSEASGRHPVLEDVLNTYAELFEISDHKFIERFWDTFVIDSLLGNFDRHGGNWGFLNNRESGSMSNSPIYDCGSCLYPELSIEKMNWILQDDNEINKRVFSFPNSALKSKVTGKKINYFEFLTEYKNSDLMFSLEKLCSYYDKRIIQGVVSATPYITPIQQRFYSTMIERRFNDIVVEAWKLQKDRYIDVATNTQNYGRTR